MRNIYIAILLSLLSAATASAQYTLVDAFPNLPSFRKPVDIIKLDTSTTKLLVLEQKGLVYEIENTYSVSDRKLFAAFDTIEGVALSDSAFAEDGLFCLHTVGELRDSNRLVFAVYLNKPGEGGIIYGCTVKLPDKDTIFITNKFEMPKRIPYLGGYMTKGGRTGVRSYTSLSDTVVITGEEDIAQNKQKKNGKILGQLFGHRNGKFRISDDLGNPYYDEQIGEKTWDRDILNRGYKHVWRFSSDQWGIGQFDFTLWVGDRGENFEEINIVESGKNYGWRIMDGDKLRDGYTAADTVGLDLQLPVYQYPHSDGNGFVVGGYVYRGTKLPALYGKYIYGDYMSGRIWSLEKQNDGSYKNELLIDAIANDTLHISSFGVDANKELYVVGYNTGRIYSLWDVNMDVGVSSPTVYVETSIQTYPNPASGEMTVELKHFTDEYVKLQLISITGNVLREQTVSTREPFKLNVSGLAYSTYQLRIETKTATYTKNVMVK